METTIRHILLIIGILILFIIIYDGWRRKRKYKSFNQNNLNTEYKNQLNKKIHNPSEDSIGQQLEVTISESNNYLNEESEKSISNDYETSNIKQKDVITILVMAEDGKSFGGYELLQTLLNNDLHYGEMQIFHRYQDAKNKDNTVFSVVSANEPGDFDLSKMGGFSCSGLILFIDLLYSASPAAAFDKMLETAKQLAEDLNGELLSSAKTSWTDEMASDIRIKLSNRVEE